jgi:hypothetical protein
MCDIILVCVCARVYALCVWYEMSTAQCAFTKLLPKFLTESKVYREIMVESAGDKK